MNFFKTAKDMLRKDIHEAKCSVNTHASAVTELEKLNKQLKDALAPKK